MIDTAIAPGLRKPSNALAAPAGSGAVAPGNSAIGQQGNTQQWEDLPGPSANENLQPRTDVATVLPPCRQEQAWTEPASVEQVSAPQAPVAPVAGAARAAEAETAGEIDNTEIVSALADLARLIEKPAATPQHPGGASRSADAGNVAPAAAGPMVALQSVQAEDEGDPVLRELDRLIARLDAEEGKRPARSLLGPSSKNSV